MKAQDCSVPAALPQSCPKVFGLSAACSSPSSYLGVIKCAYAGSNKFAPAPAHLITFIVNFHAALRAAPPRMKARWFRACGTPPSAAGIRALRFAYGATRTHTVLSANVRASGQASLPGCASACRAFIVNTIYYNTKVSLSQGKRKKRIVIIL